MCIVETKGNVTNAPSASCHTHTRCSECVAPPVRVGKAQSIKIPFLFGVRWCVVTAYSSWVGVVAVMCWRIGKENHNSCHNSADVRPTSNET
jgi:hypothetical protein